MDPQQVLGGGKGVRCSLNWRSTHSQRWLMYLCPLLVHVKSLAADSWVTLTVVSRVSDKFVLEGSQR